MKVRYATSARGSVRHVRDNILPEDARRANDSLCQRAQLVGNDADPALDVCLNCRQILNRMIENGLKVDGSCCPGRPECHRDQPPRLFRVNDADGNPGCWAVALSYDENGKVYDDYHMFGEEDCTQLSAWQAMAEAQAKPAKPKKKGKRK